MKNSWHIPRREFLRGIGVSLALPYLSAMGQSTSPTQYPRRFAAVYFPFGVSLPPDDHADANWCWFPNGEGRNYQFNDSLVSLEPHRGELSVLGGLSHPNGRKMGGHDTSDIFLTGAELKGSQLKNSVSLDQVAAAHFGNQTRYASMVLSTDGGVGEATRTSTLSYSINGQPIPSLNKPRLIFDRLFGVNDSSKNEQRRELQNVGSMLDLVLDNAKSLQRRLGKEDQTKLDEYLSSVRQIEQRVELSEQWLDVPKPSINTTGLHLEATEETPLELIRTMYDLIVLAFQTDSTRLATYQLANMNASTSFAGKFPALLGFSDNLHQLAHHWNREGGVVALGKWDRFLAEQFSYFLGRLKDIQEGEFTLLDHTMVLYGSSNSRTHENTNYPLIFAGGKGMGFRHGHFHKFTEDVPFANLHATILDRLNVSTKGFADSNGLMSELL